MASSEEYEFKLYAIVSFTKNRRSLGIKLVPSSWIYKEKGQDFCYYPDPEDYTNLDEWLQNLTLYEETWRSYKVKILTYTDDLEQGKRRLKRTLKESEAEIVKEKYNDATVLTEQPLRKQLADVERMLEVNVLDSTSQKSKKYKKSCRSLDDSQASNLMDPRLVELQNNISQIIDKKLGLMLRMVEKKIDSAKRSILYDIEHKTEELKNALASGNRSAMPLNLLEVKKKGLNGTLPLNSLEDFQTFDEQLQARQCQEDLMELYKIILTGESKVSVAIKKLMESTMVNEVEMAYSGTGRLIHGEGKLNFSKTNTFTCLKAALCAHFENSAELKNLAGKVGRWLSGASDRCGGRKQRGKAITPNTSVDQSV